MNFITWFTLLLPAPLCLSAGFVAKRVLTAYVPARLDAILTDFMRTSAGPGLMDKMKANGGGMDDIRPFIEEHLDHFLGVKLAQEMPMVGMFVGEKTIAQMKQLFLQELDLLFPEVMNRYLGGLMHKLGGPSDPIATNKFRSRILPLISRELNTIPLYGALCGVVISLIQFLLFSAGH